MTDEPIAHGSILVAFDYGPEMARRMENLAEELDWQVDLAVRLTPPLIPFLDEILIRLVIDHVALRYRWYRERTPDDQLVSLDAFVDNFIERVKAEAPDSSPATLWREYANRLDVAAEVIAEPHAPGISRHLQCYEPCCLDDPHADMVLVVHGRVIGGTTFDRRKQWSSWGPAGESSGHPTRSVAEVVQLNAYKPPPEQPNQP